MIEVGDGHYRLSSRFACIDGDQPRDLQYCVCKPFKRRSSSLRVTGAACLGRPCLLEFPASGEDLFLDLKPIKSCSLLVKQPGAPYEILFFSLKIWCEPGHRLRLRC